MVERASFIRLRIQLMDRRILEGKDLTGADTLYYLSWCSALSRILKMLGIRASQTYRPYQSQQTVD